MKALILNSGLGKRMGKYTEHNPKCMVPLEGGTTIVARQMALLQKCGVKEVVDNRSVCRFARRTCQKSRN